MSQETFIYDDEPKCKICHEEDTEEDKLYHPCKCKGSMKFIHMSCLSSWIEDDSNPSCKICRHKYKFKPIYKENTPKILPLWLIMKYLAKELFAFCKSMVYVVANIFRFGLICFICFSVANGNTPSILAVEGLLLLLLNIGFYGVYVEMNIILKRYYNMVGRAVRINPTETIQSTASTMSMTHGGLIVHVSNETETYSNDTVVLDEQGIYNFITGYVNDPFNLTKNLKMFCTTCFITVCIHALKVTERLFNAFVKHHISKVADLVWPDAHFNCDMFKHEPFYTLIDYVEFLRAQKILSFIKYLMVAIAISVVLLLVAYTVKIHTSTFKYKRPFYGMKILFEIYLAGFLVQITPLALYNYIRYRINGIPYTNGTSEHPLYPSFAVLYYVLGSLCFLIDCSQITRSFMQKLRRGIFKAPPPSNRGCFNTSLVSNRIVDTLYLELIAILRRTLLIGFLSYDMVIPIYKNSVDKYLMVLTILIIWKKSARIGDYLFKIYWKITTCISSVTGLDNYLFNKRMIKFDKRRLFWASNKPKNQTARVLQANIHRKVTVDLHVGRYRKNEKQMGFANQENSTRNQTHRTTNRAGMNYEYYSQLSENRTNYAIYSSYSNSTNHGNYAVYSVPNKFEINNERFIKYFGKKHRRSLTIVYKPPFHRFSIRIIKMACLLMTKCLVVLMKYACNYGLDLICKHVHIPGYEINRSICYWVLFSMMTSFILHPTHAIYNLVTGVFNNVISPLILSISIICIQSKVVNITELFCVCSVLSNLIISFLQAIIQVRQPTTFNHLLLDFILAIGFNICGIIYYIGIYMNYLLISPVTYVLIHGNVKLIMFVYKMLFTDYFKRVRDMQYLIEKIVVNYNE